MNVYTFHTRMFISQAVYSIYIFETVKYSFCSYSFLLTVLWTLQLFAAGVIVFGFARAFFVHSPRWFIQYIFCDICLCCNCHATAFQFKLMGKKYLSTLIAFYRCHLFRTPIYVALCYTLRIHRSRWSTAVFFFILYCFSHALAKAKYFYCLYFVGWFICIVFDSIIWSQYHTAVNSHVSFSGFGNAGATQGAYFNVFKLEII